MSHLTSYRLSADSTTENVKIISTEKKSMKCNVQFCSDNNRSLQCDTHNDEVHQNEALLCYCVNNGVKFACTDVMAASRSLLKCVRAQAFMKSTK